LDFSGLPVAVVSSNRGAQERRVAGSFEPAGAPLKLHQVRCVVAAARRGSFRKAALALNLQQSSVSRSIQELETRLGAVLFQRGAGGVALTPVGLRFLEDAELAMTHLGRAANTVGQVAQDRQLLRLGVVPIPGSGPLPQLLNTLMQGAPAVRLSIDEGSSADLMTAVRTGGLDVAIALVPGGGYGVVTTPAWREALYWALPSGDPRAGAATACWRDVMRCDLVLPSGEVGDLIAERLARAGGFDAPMCRAGSETALRLVALKQASAIVTAAARGAGVPGVVFRPLAGGDLPVIAVRLTRNEKPVVRRFMAMLGRRVEHAGAGQARWGG
jgi:DNA-binding transcriptional LysR family regulator